jgi:hypothetical protein
MTKTIHERHERNAVRQALERTTHDQHDADDQNDDFHLAARSTDAALFVRQNIPLALDLATVQAIVARGQHEILERVSAREHAQRKAARCRRRRCDDRPPFDPPPPPLHNDHEIEVLQSKAVVVLQSWWRYRRTCRKSGARKKACDVMEQCLMRHPMTSTRFRRAHEQEQEHKDDTNEAPPCCRETRDRKHDERNTLEALSIIAHTAYPHVAANENEKGHAAYV